MEQTDWHLPLTNRLPHAYFNQLMTFINEAYQNGTVYPPKEKIFAALQLTPLAQTKVIIVGQDPYPQPGKAQGLSFSYPDTYHVRRPDSITNIQTELANEGYQKTNSDLTGWATQGVLLLNATLTVPVTNSAQSSQRAVPNGHAGKLWQTFTNEVIKVASDDERPKVFILWGGNAQKVAPLIDHEKHLVIKTSHPSPMSARRGFLGSNCFQAANDFLTNSGQTPIDWTK